MGVVGAVPMGGVGLVGTSGVGVVGLVGGIGLVGVGEVGEVGSGDGEVVGETEGESPLIPVPPATSDSPSGGIKTVRADGVALLVESTFAV